MWCHGFKRNNIQLICIWSISWPVVLLLSKQSFALKSMCSSTLWTSRWPNQSAVCCADMQCSLVDGALPQKKRLQFFHPRMLSVLLHLTTVSEFTSVWWYSHSWGSKKLPVCRRGTEQQQAEHTYHNNKFVDLLSKSGTTQDTSTTNIYYVYHNYVDKA